MSTTQVFAELPSVLAPGTHITPDEHRVSNDQFVFSVAARLELSQAPMYRRGGQLGVVLASGRFEPVNAQRMRVLVDRTVHIERLSTKDGLLVRTYQPCTKQLAELLIENIPARSIEAIANYPIAIIPPKSAGNTVWFDTPGFHPVTADDTPSGYFVLQTWDTNVEPIDPVEILCDFPFATTDDRVNALALLLTPFVRPMIHGPVPMFTIDAAVHRTGKTLLGLTLLDSIVTAGGLSMTPIPDNPDELGKLVFSSLLSASPFLFLDNIPERRTFASPQIAMLLTSRNYSNRVLGASKFVSMPNTLMVVGTSNNLRMSPELEERTVWIRLEPPVENPSERTGFRYPNVADYARRHRSALIAGVRRMVDRWDGRRSRATFGAFEEWAGIVYGILEANGFSIDTAARRARIEDHDEDKQALEALISVWKNGPLRRTPTDLLDCARETDCFSWIFDSKPSAKGQAMSLGRWLNGHVGQIIGGWKLSRKRDNSAVYYSINLHSAASV